MKLNFPMASRHFLLRDKVLRQVLLLIIEAIWQCSEEISVKLLPMFLNQKVLNIKHFTTEKDKKFRQRTFAIFLSHMRYENG